ncbi:MAG: cupin domain-containing protein [Phycisphaerae bacterium]|nr:cupin domain-containing protein [Phycisphaerae bacterium]
MNTISKVTEMSKNEPFVAILSEKSEHQPLLTGLPQTGGMRSGMVNLLPGRDCGEHSTEDNEEMLIFLSGQGQAVIGDRKTLQIGKGKIIYIPPRTIHNIMNNSNEPLCYVYCVSPTDSNSFDRLRTMGEK